MAKMRELREATALPSDARLDRRSGVVRDVKIIGLTSKWGYDYSPDALRRAAPLYEGVAVNIDHPPRDRPGTARAYESRFGRLRDVRFVPGDGLRGNLHYNRGHRLAEQFEYDVEHDPSNCGLSHNARGPVRRRGDRMVCEAIESVHSVDVVADPATTRGLFEGGSSMPVKAKKRSAQRRVDRSPDRVSKLVESIGEARAVKLLEEMAATAAPTEEAGSGSGDGPSSNGLKAMIMQVFDDPNIDVAETVKRITKIMKTFPEMVPGFKNDVGNAGDEEEVASEGRDSDRPADGDDRLEEIVEEIRADRRERRLAVLLEEYGFKPTAKQRAALLRLDDPDDQQLMLESFADSAGPKGRGRAKSRDLSEGGAGGGGSAKRSSDEDWLASVAE